EPQESRRGDGEEQRVGDEPAAPQQVEERVLHDLQGRAHATASSRWPARGSTRPGPLADAAAPPPIKLASARSSRGSPVDARSESRAPRYLTLPSSRNRTSSASSSSSLMT